MKKNFIHCTYIILLLFFTISCENKDWNDHYDEDAGRGDQEVNLIKGIREKGYTAYAAALEKLKFDEALNSGMRFTLFVVPDDQFSSATQGMTDEQVSAYLLNTILPGKYLSSEFTKQSYQPIAGDVIAVSMADNTLTNLHSETVQITKKDIQILGAVLFEISDFLPQYPDLHSWLEENGYSKYLSYINTGYSIDSTYSEKRLGITNTGLTELTIYPKDFYTPAESEMKDLVFVIPDNGTIEEKIDNPEVLIRSFFKGANEGDIEEEVQQLIAEFEKTKLKVLSRNEGKSFEYEDENIILHLFTGNSIALPVDKVKQQVKLSKGNIAIISNVVLRNWVPESNEIRWNFVSSRTDVEFIGDGFSSIGDWRHYAWTNQAVASRGAGSGVNFIFPVLYTTEYEVEFQFQNVASKNWPYVNFYVNDNLLGEVNLRDESQNTYDGGQWESGNLPERCGLVKLPTTVIITDYTQPVGVKLIVTRDWPTSGNEIFAPYSVLFRMKE